MRTHSGKGGKSFNDLQLAAEVRTLGLKEVKKALALSDDSAFKQAVILRLAANLLPRLNEHTGQDGAALPAPIYGGQAE